MKNIGLIGGVGWPSTIDYYRIISEEANKKAGDLSSPNILIYSVNFEPLKRLQLSGQWEKTVPILSDAAVNLEKAGADFILICSGTTNISSHGVQESVSIPIIDIVEPTAVVIGKMGIKTVGLLGTKPTMEHPFFQSRLAEFGIKALVPNESDRGLIHDVIYQELCLNIVRKESKREYLRIVESLIELGVEAIILGCTEIPMLISPSDITVPVFDIAKLHALWAVDRAVA